MASEKENKITVILEADALKVQDAIAFVSDHECGAISIFMGTTRALETPVGEPSYVIDRSVTQLPKAFVASTRLFSLFYEAYPEMALKIMHEICATELREGRVEKCYLAHRTGLVMVGEASIIVACSSKHRREAHSTVMKILDEVKAQVPIWKRGCNERGNDRGDWSQKSEAFWLQNAARVDSKGMHDS